VRMMLQKSNRIMELQVSLLDLYIVLLIDL
jgi:hypothetical protein